MRQRGYNGEHRSCCVVIDYDDKPHLECRLLLGAGHTIEALYECHEEDLESGQMNPQIQVSIAAGTWAYEVEKITPPECQLEIVDMLNKNLLASGTNLRQVFNQANRLDDLFEQYKGDETVASLGGQSAHETFQREWLKKHSGCEIFCGRYKYWRDCIILQNNLGKNKERFMALCQKYIDNINRKVTLEAIVRNVCHFDRVCRTHFEKSMSAKRYEHMWWEGVACFLPLVNCEADIPGHKLCFELFEPDRIERMHVKMNTDKTLQLKIRHKAAKEPKDPKEAKAANADKKDKSKEKENADKENVEPDCAIVQKDGKATGKAAKLEAAKKEAAAKQAAKKEAANELNDKVTAKKEPKPGEVQEFSQKRALLKQWSGATIVLGALMRPRSC